MRSLLISIGYENFISVSNLIFIILIVSSIHRTWSKQQRNGRLMKRYLRWDQKVAVSNRNRGMDIETGS